MSFSVLVSGVVNISSGPPVAGETVLKVGGHNAGWLQRPLPVAVVLPRRFVFLCFRVEARLYSFKAVDCGMPHLL